MICVRQEAVYFVMAQCMLPSNRNVFMFTKRMYKPTKCSLQNKMY